MCACVIQPSHAPRVAERIAAIRRGYGAASRAENHRQTPCDPNLVPQESCPCGLYTVLQSNIYPPHRWPLAAGRMRIRPPPPRPLMSRMGFLFILLMSKNFNTTRLSSHRKSEEMESTVGRRAVPGYASGRGVASCVEQDPRQGVVCCTRWSSPESYPSLEAKLHS